MGKAVRMADIAERLNISVKSDLTCMLEIVPLEAEKSASLPALVVKRKVDGIIFMGGFGAEISGNRS